MLYYAFWCITQRDAQMYRICMYSVNMCSLYIPLNPHTLPSAKWRWNSLRVLGWKFKTQSKLCNPEPESKAWTINPHSAPRNVHQVALGVKNYERRFVTHNKAMYPKWDGLSLLRAIFSLSPLARPLSARPSPVHLNYTLLSIDTMKSMMQKP